MGSQVRLGRTSPCGRLKEEQGERGRDARSGAGTRSICLWQTHFKLIWLLQSGLWRKQYLVVAFGVHFSFRLILDSLLFFFPDQTANDWQESCKSKRMLAYFPHFSPPFSEISACNILMLWHKFGWEGELLYLHTHSVCDHNIHVIRHKDMWWNAFNTSLFGAQGQLCSWDVTAKSGFFTRKERKSVLLTDLVFSLHSWAIS